MAESRSQVVLLIDGAPPDVVSYAADGLKGERTVPVEQVTAVRQGTAGVVGMVDLEQLPGGRVSIGGVEIPIPQDAMLVELAVVESGWHVGSVASDPLPLVPYDSSVLFVPVLGWMTWVVLAAGIAWLTRERS